jgi:hypothetical protein
MLRVGGRPGRPPDDQPTGQDRPRRRRRVVPELSDERGFRLDVVGAMRELRPPVRPEPQRLVLDQGRVELEPHSLTVCTVALPLPHDAGASTVTLREPRDWALTPAGWRRSTAR